MDDVDQVVRAAVGAAERVLAGSEPGCYLHGSAASRSMTETSDIDLLVLCGRVVDASDRARLESALQDPRLDVKVFAWREFAADPWVDLDAAVHVGGRDWRPAMPRPTLDQRARESVLMVCAASRQGTGEQVSPKYVGWLISALLAARYGVVPPSRAAALEAIAAVEPARLAVLGTMDDAVGRLAAEVLDLLRDQASRKAGPLGPACWEVIERYLGDG